MDPDVKIALLQILKTISKLQSVLIHSTLHGENADPQQIQEELDESLRFVGEVLEQLREDQ